MLMSSLLHVIIVILDAHEFPVTCDHSDMGCSLRISFCDKYKASMHLQRLYTVVTNKDGAIDMEAQGLIFCYC